MSIWSWKSEQLEQTGGKVVVPLLNRTITRLAGLLLCSTLLAVSFGLNLWLGANKIAWTAVWDSLFHYDSTAVEQMIVRTTRLPRAVIALLVGAALAVAGALMQGLTRNPLASPSIFGINTGAVFFIVLALNFFKVGSMNTLIWIAFAGAALAAAAVFSLGSLGRDGLTPVKVVLAGAAVSALFSSFTQGMLVLNESGLQDVLFWLAGSIAGRELQHLQLVLPYMLAALVTAQLLARPITILNSGDDVAKGLGQKTWLVKVAAAAVIVALAGSAVSVAGSIGFVGLVMPHIARFLAGIDYRWVIPYSALLGAILLLLADVAVRYIVMPGEVPIGITTALIGAPFFVYIARKGLRSREEGA